DRGTIAVACPSPRAAWSTPRQALSFLAWQATVDDHHSAPLSPGLLEVRRHGEHLASRRAAAGPAPTASTPATQASLPSFPPIRRWEHPHLLPLPRRLPRELAPLLPRGPRRGRRRVHRRRAPSASASHVGLNLAPSGRTLLISVPDT